MELTSNNPRRYARAFGAALLGAVVWGQAAPVRAANVGNRKWWSGELHRRYKPSAKGYRLVVSFPGQSVTLPPRATVQIQYGWGHGFYLGYQQWRISQRGVMVEEVIWNGRIRPPASARRAWTTRWAIRALLAAVSSLRTVKLAERAPPPPPSKKGGFSIGGMGFWSSSSDLFVLVRVLDGQGRPILCEEFAGYQGSTAQLKYLPLVAIRDLAMRRVKAIRSWKPVPAHGLRTTHFPQAFSLNQKIMIGQFHWWVMEYSVEALGTLGTPAVLPALRYLRQHYPKLLPRQRRKLELILGKPRHYLVGPAKRLPVP